MAKRLNNMRARTEQLKDQATKCWKELYQRTKGIEGDATRLLPSISSHTAKRLRGGKHKEPTTYQVAQGAENGGSEICNPEEL